MKIIFQMKTLHSKSIYDEIKNHIIVLIPVRLNLFHPDIGHHEERMDWILLFCQPLNTGMVRVSERHHQKTDLEQVQWI